MTIVCNNIEPRCFHPTFVLGSSGSAIGNEVFLIFTQGEVPWS